MTIYFAVQAAFFFSASHILIRRGLVASNSTTGTIVSIVISAVWLWIIAMFSIPLASFYTHAIWYFIAGGIFAPAIGRLMTFIAIERIGVARSVPVTNTSPLFSSIMAVALMGEQWPVQNILGTSLVILGIVILSGTQTQKTQWRKIDLIYPMLAAFCFAAASVLRKLGLLIVNLPLMAATVSATTAVLVGAIVHWAQGGWQVFSLPRRSLSWFVAAGTAHTAAMLSVFYALSYGKVVIVDPLIGANPVLSLLLTTIFLRDLEALNLRVVVGAVTTVAGSILIMTL